MRIRELQALPTLTEDEQAELTRRRLDLERDESFVEYLIELARDFGISTYLYRLSDRDALLFRQGWALTASPSARASSSR